MAFTVESSTYNYETHRYDKTKVTKGQGTTLRKYYRDVQIMSDVWESALHVSYFDTESQSIKTDFWVKDVTIDATEEVKVLARESLRKSFEEVIRLRMEDEARVIVKESRVKVTSGRTGKGTVGKVVAIIERPYGMGYRSSLENKLGIATSDVMVDVPARNGKVYKNYRDVVWVWARNCDLIEVPKVDMDDLRQLVESELDRSLRHDWRGVL